MEHPNSSGPASQCLINNQIVNSPRYYPSKFYGGAPLPGDWKEHLNCKFCDAIAIYITTKHVLHPENRPHGNKADSDTSYAFTLTMPPNYSPSKPVETVAKNILEHGLTNKPYEKATEWAYVLEHTEQGTPHIHGMYKTPSGRRISSKYFKRYWTLWDETKKMGHGHQGGYHQKSRSHESYTAYLEKEGVVFKSLV